MSLVLDILQELWDRPLYYKGLRVNIFGVPKFKDLNRNSLKSTASRMRRSGLISRNDDGWQMTPRGRKYFQERFVFKQFDSPFKKGEPRNLLLMFDIPEEKRQYRDWLREQLKEYGYVMMQQSAWVGPSPLPKEFVGYIKSLGIKDGIKTFKLAKSYVLE